MTGAHLLVLLSFGCIHFAAQAKTAQPVTPCKVYFMVAEQDDDTSGQKIIGLNDSQADWWGKDGARDAPGICLVNANAKGEKTASDSVDQKYVDGVVGSAPLYSVVWEGTKTDNHGHNTYQAHGTLLLWKPSADGKGEFVAVGPIANTNQTIFASPSLSLLKSAIAMIEKANGMESKAAPRRIMWK